MANKFNNGGNASAMKAAEEEKRAAERALAAARHAMKRACYHNRISGAKLIPIKESNRISQREKDKYGDSVYICSQCGEILDIATYSRQEVEDVFFKLHSMLAQIQVLAGAKLESDDAEELASAIDRADYLENLMGSFYTDMVESLTNKDKNGKKQGSSKGGIGVTSGMMQ